MNLFEIPEAVHASLAAVGSAISMVWMKETAWTRRVVLFLGGVVFGIVATPDVSHRVNLSTNLVALMLGLGSMATMAKLFETIQGFNLGKLARDLAYKLGGLPAPPEPAITVPPKDKP